MFCIEAVVLSLTNLPEARVYRLVLRVVSIFEKANCQSGLAY